MKNLHLLPTDKPSRLHLWTEINGSKLELCELEYSHTRNTQHIYITSDEEIKEGDWVVTPDKTIMLVTTKYATESSFMIGNSKHKGSPYYIEFCKKIILTTDQDLIADGVQAIDDEFLEWFVKNPSCESVTVYDGLFENRIWKKYIITPKEKQKQHLIDIMRGDEELGIYWEGVEKSNYIMSIDPHDKQETLEEAALNYSKQFLSAEDSLPQCDFKKGAEWQADRMYSEEDMIAFMQFIISQESLGNTSSVSVITAKYYLEQFKKK